MQPSTRPAGAALATLAALLLLALAAVSPAAARAASFVVETGGMRIRQPASIAASLDSAIGDFGVPLYGGTLSGSVVYVDANRDGCKEFVGPLPSTGTLPTVLLVDRGGCFFVEKAMNGQKAGAKAVVVADHTEEPLLTMAVPEDKPELAALVKDITIPVVLVTKGTGDKMKGVLGAGSSHPDVEVELDWSDSIAHPDNRVEWELWFTSQDACGQACDSIRAFMQTFKETATSLEEEGFTQFTPHVMTQPCSRWLPRPQCDANCIHRGRYCAVNSVPQQYSSKYNGAQVVEQNKRHLCAFRVANATQPPQPWRWWDYAAGFATHCTMAVGRFDAQCAEDQLRAAGIDSGAVAACMGRSDADSTHDLMEAQVAAQADAEGSGRGRVIMLPTVVINADQFRGSLAAPAVLRALCAGFSEGSEPHICLTGALNVDECASGKDTCWHGPNGLSACMDTFRGYVCRCPHGYEGDGHTCTDIDECALHIDGCDQICHNTPGSYQCACKSGYTLHGGQGAPGMCIPNSLSPRRMPGWLVALLAFASVASLTAAGLFAYRWRLRREMHAELRAIVREYLPLGASEAESEALREGLLGRKEAAAAAGSGGNGSGGSGSGGGRRGGRDVESGEGGGAGGGRQHEYVPGTPGEGWEGRRFPPPALTELSNVPSPSPRRLV